MNVTVLSGSMEPTIRAGETVSVQSEVRARSGDVAAIKHDGQLLIHRLHARISLGGRTWFVHRGDATPAWGLADEREIVGVLPGRWRPPTPPKSVLFLRFGALLRFLGFQKSFARLKSRR